MDRQRAVAAEDLAEHAGVGGRLALAEAVDLDALLTAVAAVHDDALVSLREPLAGAHAEARVAPARQVHLQEHLGEGLGPACRVHALLLRVPGVARPAGAQRVRRAGGAQRGRPVLGRDDEREELEHVVLQDVAQRARPVVEAGAALQRERLLPEDLDLLGALGVEVDDLLRPRHPEDVVDPEGVVGRVGEHRVELDGAVQVLAERLLDRDPAACRQTGGGERADRGREAALRQREIGGERRVAAQRDRAGDGRRIGDVDACVAQLGEDRAAGDERRLQRVALEALLHVGAERLVVPVVDVRADDAEPRGQVALGVEHGERRQQEPTGEIAAGAEEHESMEHASNLRRPAECTLQTTKGERDVSIRSTHVGSLIRPASLLAFEAAIERGESYDEAAYAETLKSEVADVVKRQADAGIDIVSDGEFGKANWIAYLYNRISGVGPRELGPDGLVPAAEPRPPGVPGHVRAARQGDDARVRRERGPGAGSEHLGVQRPDRVRPHRASTTTSRTCAPRSRASTPRASCPVVAPASTYWLENQHYGTEEEFVYALADALAVEYNAIVDSGFMLQVDDAVLMHEMDSILAEGGSMKDYRNWAQLRVDALNHALKGIPPEKVRYHVCWGSWHGPHAYDPPLAEVVDLVLQVNAHAYMMEQANPRHEHEWRVWEDVKLPDGKMLIPGVVTHHTVIVEHPDLVADRLVRLAELVGPDNVMAGTDCGFAQTAFMQRVHPEVQWAKLDGARRGRPDRERPAGRAA